MIDRTLEKKSECTGCWACYNACPVGAISMVDDEEGFKYPHVDYETCIECKRCVKVCPTINEKQTYKRGVAYACYNKDEEIRRQSSSGGIFTLIAEEFISRDGKVFGAVFDENFDVHHDGASDMEEVGRMRGSKYVQSTIGETYKEVKDLLNSGEYVLFSGTPCQVGGLRTYLGRDYSKLFCMDNICHGIPSPKVFSEYRQYLEKKHMSRMISYEFRNKEKGWIKYHTKVNFANSDVHLESLNEDLFMRAFLIDICLRPSCHNCSFKGLNRQSDITMADFWGVDKIIDDKHDDKGISLIFINSEKGKNILNSVEKKLVIEPTNMDLAVKYNSAAINSVKPHKNRESFFEHLDVMDFPELVEKYCTYSFKIRLKQQIKSILKKILVFLGVRKKG